MNGVTRISSEQDVMMITFTEADTASALADALTAFAQKGVVVDMICQSAPRAATIDFSFTMPASYFESAMQTISEYRTGAGSAPLISSGYSICRINGHIKKQAGTALCGASRLVFWLFSGYSVIR